MKSNSLPKRIQLSRKKAFKLPPNTVVVSRPSQWGNPFKALPVSIGGPDAAEAVRLFEYWLSIPGPGRELAACARRDLRGKNLACWCKLDAPCHADVLLKVANDRFLKAR